jgi:sirohydrochlorin cobaltochelatase
MKTIIVLAAHGAPARDCPRLPVGLLMALESMHGLVGRSGLLARLHGRLDRFVRTWPRTADNDPYKIGVELLAADLARQSGCQVIAGYNEFCSPAIPQAIEAAVAAGAQEVVVATTMTTQGGEHAEQEIRELVEQAQTRHPDRRIWYAWPFDPGQVARLFAAEIERLRRA